MDVDNAHHVWELLMSVNFGRPPGSASMRTRWCWILTISMVLNVVRKSWANLVHRVWYVADLCLKVLRDTYYYIYRKVRTFIFYEDIRPLPYQLCIPDHGPKVRDALVWRPLQ